ncbi:hypothetical protein DIBBI_gp81 [Xanthomonas phage vB_XveM_DIBBI]|uniref:Uncharacterized protein n=1 Tax=Xanthomonas phage vB_XveM_DIBBI TaxID=1129194 RepID=I3PH14_9CAUD|nr:hypothetical protein DIBBI_gp81 [Xanthomonas phage vB_XveM_DIBBI]AEX65749.1 hypothetical protein DIBBI_081 [Xanthomonas phage vB_XveM_DIBBI]
MYDYYQENAFQSRPQSMQKKQPKAPDPFDEIFEFELNIEQHLTPQQKQQRQIEETTKKFFADGVWLATQEQREAFRELSPADQLIATFGNCHGFAGSELEAICQHLQA